MAILQISKIQQRTGNLVDLPQLDEAEFGWATDAKKLFIGKLTPNENIEILTSYSTIEYNQINGSAGTLDINANTFLDGQVLAVSGNTWTNKGRGAGGLIALGDVSNVKIDGGAISYVLETDGLGNLSWTPKSSIVAFIKNISNANAAVVTTVADNLFTNGMPITITGVPGPGVDELNGNTYYVSVLTSSEFELFADSALTTPVDTTSLGAFPFATVSQTSSSTDRITVSTAVPFSNTIPTSVVFEGNIDTANTNIVGGQVYYIAEKSDIDDWIKISETPGGNVVTLGSALGLTANVYASGVRALSTVSSGGGTAAAGGANSSIQFNNSGILQGSALLGWDAGNTTLRVTGNANVSNLNATGIVTSSRLVSNVATGVAPPLTVTSTDRVANLNVDRANVADFVAATSQTTGTFFPLFANNSSNGNRSIAVNSNISVNLATGNLTIPLLNVVNVATVGSLLTTTLTTGANTTPGTITGNWTLTPGSVINTAGADLAEYYEADIEYTPGTVVMFGGDKEITLAIANTTKVAGVVSTQPSVVMNATCSGKALPVALQGRVPCNVTGSVQKGDMMISAGNGYAVACAAPKLGMVIGKALEDFSGISGVIEVVVGRL